MVKAPPHHRVIQSRLLINLAWVRIFDPFMLCHGTLKEHIHVLLINQLVQVWIGWHEINFFINHGLEEIFILIHNVGDFTMLSVVSEINSVLDDTNIVVR